MTDKERILILGAGRLAVDVADMIEDEAGRLVVGFVIDRPPFERGATLLGRPIYWIDELAELDKDLRAVCAIGSSQRFGIIAAAEGHGLQFTKVIHPSARVSRAVVMREGAIISGGAQVAAGTTIGRHVIVNRGALIGPNCVLHDYAYVAPGANLADGAQVGSKTWVGLGAIVLERVKIGDQSFVGAGALVTKDVPGRVKVVGAPAMIIEEDIEPA